ncbi:MAG: DNA-binding domain-containing protein [Pseudomonadota bacterium]
MTAVSQTDFRRAVFDPELARPAGLTDGKTRPAGKRFDVYRNNVIVSLKEAMRTGFPIIEKLIGAENFNNLSGIFVRAHPPSDPRLALYGGAFPEFLAGFEPLKHAPYLADVARLELAMRDSYNAAESQTLSGAAFAGLSPEQLAGARIDLAAATRLITSEWPLFDIWRFNTSDDAPKPRNEAQAVLVTRPEFDPVAHLLPPGAGGLLIQLSQQQPLGEALEAAHEAVADFDFGSTLSLLLESGALAALHLPATD